MASLDPKTSCIQYFFVKVHQLCMWCVPVLLIKAEICGQAWGKLSQRRSVGFFSEYVCIRYTLCSAFGPVCVLLLCGFPCSQMLSVDIQPLLWFPSRTNLLSHGLSLNTLLTHSHLGLLWATTTPNKSTAHTYRPLQCVTVYCISTAQSECAILPLYFVMKVDMYQCPEILKVCLWLLSGCVPHRCISGSNKNKTSCRAAVHKPVLNTLSCILVFTHPLQLKTSWVMIVRSGVLGTGKALKCAGQRVQDQSGNHCYRETSFFFIHFIGHIIKKMLFLLYL